MVGLGAVVVAVIIQGQKEEGPKKLSTSHIWGVGRKISENLSPIHELMILISNTKKAGSLK